MKEGQITGEEVRGGEKRRKKVRGMCAQVWRGEDERTWEVVGEEVNGDEARREEARGGERRREEARGERREREP